VGNEHEWYAGQRSRRGSVEGQGYELTVNWGASTLEAPESAWTEREQNAARAAAVQVGLIKINAGRRKGF
jgi:hypothetical protein